jgi:DNA recombination protein RmuC
MLLTLGLLAGAAVTAVAFLIARQALVADRARLAAELAAAISAQSQLKDSFAALSQEALRDNRQDFLQNAEQLLGPVRDTLGRVQSQLAEVDKHREGSYRAVSSQLGQLAQTQEQLRRATDGLQSSLRSPNVRGKWGEIQLKRIVELAGMLEQCDFIEKPTITSEQGGRQTPDLIVRLPGNTSIVVDAKVPIDAYLAATNAKTEAERQDLMVAHARQVREHIRTLGGKEYWRQFQPSPEFVVMFLPLEPLLSAAFEHDGTLLEQAASLRVIPATPMTLLALLRAVSYGWSQQQIAKNAEEIQALGRELYERLATMTEHLEGVGRSIKQAADGYDRFIGSLETKVLPGARRFKELGVTSTKEVGDPEPLNLSVRRVRKNELTGSLLDE